MYVYVIILFIIPQYMYVYPNRFLGHSYHCSYLSCCEIRNYTEISCVYVCAEKGGIIFQRFKSINKEIRIWNVWNVSHKTTCILNMYIG
mgnify:CR=1 FL=1